MAMSYNGFIALGKETAWASRVARTRFMRFLQAEFVNNPNWVVSNHSQSRYTHGAYPGMYEHVLRATVEARADTLGEILRSLFWVEPVTTHPGTLAYEHLFIPPDSETTPTIKSYTPELRYGTANISEVGAGGWIDTATFAWDDAMLTVAFEMPSHSPSLDTPTASPSFSDVAPFMFHQLTMIFVDPDDETNNIEVPIRNGSLAINNNATKNRPSGSRFLEAPEAGAFTATLQFSRKMTDLQDLKDMWSADGDLDEIDPNFCEAKQRHVRFLWEGCLIEELAAVEFTADAAANTLEDVGHGLLAGTRVTLSNVGGALPAGLSLGVAYYVVNPTADDFQVSLVPNGDPVDITGAGTGTHSYTVTHYFELEFDMPAVRVQQPSYPMSGKEEIVEGLTLEADYDDTEGRAISARLKNTVSGY